MKDEQISYSQAANIAMVYNERKDSCRFQQRLGQVIGEFRINGRFDERETRLLLLWVKAVKREYWLHISHK